MKTRKPSGKSRKGRTTPPLTVADSASVNRRRVWLLLLTAFASVAVPLIIGGYALRQAGDSQQQLIETSRLAQADASAAHVGAALLDARKEVIALSREGQLGQALRRKDSAATASIIADALKRSRYFRGLSAAGADDVALATAPAGAIDAFRGPEVTATPGSFAGIRRDGEDVFWVVRFTVRDVSGQRAGSVAGAISLDRILKARPAATAGELTRIALLDRSGEVLVASDLTFNARREQSAALLEALAAGRRGITRAASSLTGMDEINAVVPVVETPLLLVVSQAAKEADKPVVLLERWLWLAFLGLTLSSAALFWHALYTFRHFDRRLLRECSLATGVIEGTSDMVFVKDSEGHYLLVNEPAAQFLGRPREEIVGKAVGDLLDVDEAERTMRNDREVLDSGRPTKREYRGVDGKTGKPYVVWTARHPLRDREGSVAAVVGVSRDVTERHRLIGALREGEHRLRLIVDNLPARISYVDRDERFQFANAKLVEWLPEGAADPIGRKVLDVTGPIFHGEVKEYIRKALAGELVTFEGSFESRGLQRFHRSTYVPDLGPDAEVRGFYAMTFDVTELKLIERRIATNEKMLRLMADSLPVLIAYIDVEGRFRFNNATYASWLGKPVSKLAGRLLREVMPDALLEQVAPHLEGALAGETTSFDFAWPGTDHFLHGTYIPDADAYGEVAGVYALFYDVTERKKLELELREQAQVDELTGLPNRRRLREELEAAVARSERHGGGLAVVYLDLDGLKSINDRFGHEGGDTALQEFARRLIRNARQGDTVARLSGDEFLVLLDPVAGADDARAFAQHFSEALREPMMIGSHELVLSASMGIALRQPGEVDTDALIRRADEALYEVKSSRRGGMHVQS